MKPDIAGSTTDDPHKIGAVERGHEIDNRRTAGLGFKFSFEDERSRAIAPADAENRVFRRNEPASVFCCPEQAGKARGRIKTRPTQPIDRTIAADQGSRFAVADQRIIFDLQGHACRSRIPVLRGAGEFCWGSVSR
jgi:hypothetical protein